MKNDLALIRFEQLVKDISGFYFNARKEQVRFAWLTGRRVVEEEQNGEVRASYGEQLILKLSEELTRELGPGFSEENLARMRRFYLQNRILSVPTKLDWTDYVELLPVKDDKARKQLEQRIVKEGLKTNAIRQIVQDMRQLESKKSGASSSAAAAAALKKISPLKRPADLTLDTFALSPLKVKLEDGHTLVDCGFFVSWPLRDEALKTLAVVKEMSYTYKATVDRVVDGDTILALIEVGFGIIVRDRLRLRGVDTPELSTPEGKAAKRFLEKILPSGAVVVIKSRKCRTDIYGRFVADVFFREGVTDAARIIAGGVYLNQHLIDSGHAVRVNE